jgi:hypothetical protein
MRSRWVAGGKDLLVRLKAVAALSAAFLMATLTIHPATATTRHFSHEVQDARNYALRRIGAVQFKCLDALFDRESHWNPRAHNHRSGAYGIPQAVPGSKMRKAGKDWLTNPTTQVKWGLTYVQGRYGTACNALSHAYATGWY